MPGSLRLLLIDLRHALELRRSAEGYIRDIRRAAEALPPGLDRRELEAALRAVLREEKAVTPVTGRDVTAPALSRPLSAPPGPPGAVERVRRHLEAHPEDAGLSTRVLGAKLGVSHMSVSRARKKPGR